MQEIFYPLWQKGLQDYIDDILLYGETFRQCLDRLIQTLQICRDRFLKLKLPKCSFFPESIKYLGFQIDAQGYEPLEEKVSKIAAIEAPTSKSELRRVLGLFGYYRRFIRNFAQIAVPLTEATKKTVPFCWTSERAEALETLKQQLAGKVRNYHFNPDWKIILDTDASEVAIGAILQQEDEEGNLFPVIFLSRRLSETESRWPTRDREIFSIVWPITLLRRYLLGREFRVRNDHAPLVSLRWLLKAEQPKLIRWALLLSEYNFTIEHRKGNQMEHVDYLSRMNVPDTFENLLADKVDIFALTFQSPIEDQYIADINEGKDEESKLLRQQQEADTDFQSLRDRVLFLEGGLWRHQGRLYIPSSLRENYLMALHYSPFGGHLGSRKLDRKLRRNFFWPKMSEDCRRFSTNCLTCCRQRSPKTRTICGHLQTLGPFDLVGLDLVGPIRLDSTNYYIFTMVDHYTKWAEAAVVTSISAETLARVFMVSWIQRFCAAPAGESLQ
eukprot:GHVU01186068.1.p1 GENE.GHVU01186068.1~~GHVU01186068.1.p1  ORF type:complete len:499 (-),score=31.16 GHVU01186068.1:17-1513(-)